MSEPPDEVPVTPAARFAPRNWRVATKLYAILLIPVVVALALGGVRVYGSYDRWQDADAAERTAELVGASTAYAHALIDERDVTALPLLTGDTDNPVIEESRRRTDAARVEFHARVDDAPQTDSLRRRLNAVVGAEPQLGPLRERAYTDGLPDVQTEEGYVAIQHPLMSFANELGLGTGNITSYGRSIYAMSLAKSASSLQRSIGIHLLVAPGPDERTNDLQLIAFRSYDYLENIATAEYLSAGDPGATEGLSAAEREQAIAEEEMVGLISSGRSAEELAEAGVTPEAWFRLSTAEFDGYRGVEEELVESALSEARDIASSALRDMIFNSVVVLGALGLAFALAALMARSMSQNMTRLRTAAIEVAEQRLPAVVDQLSRSDTGEVVTRVTPIGISSQDEMGQVARAFDQVHQEAVRLASEQALLRGNVSAIFTNLSSRNQGLIERQLALISELENHEADPEQLENLFRLDHLATRMRRNGENLLVLAGKEPENRWNRPVALIDVMRAAASEVEAYARIELSGVPDREIHGSVVNDLVHLLAELLENATTFSSPQSKVRVTATRLPDGRIMIEIHDKGIGLGQEDFAEINKRLADPPAVDVAVSRRMGLYVVGRLAERHDIRVQLRPSGEQSGTTSLVMLPEAITHGGTGRPQAPEEDFTVSRVVTEQRHISDADREAGARTAAELGFDDSRYAVSPDTADPDPLGYSPLSGERRVAPDTQPLPALPGPAYPPPVYGELAAAEQGFGAFRPHPEPEFGAPDNAVHSVGFTGPDPAAADHRPSAGAGLPRREQHWQQPEEEPAQRLRDEPPPFRAPEETRWDRGPRRDERTGGTTSSGLPRRVPRANLSEPPGPEPESGGGQVSRDPSEVRGRLSSLHRGVQQGRDAGTGRGAQNDDRGSGPGHTYGQER